MTELNQKSNVPIKDSKTVMLLNRRKNKQNKREAVCMGKFLCKLLLILFIYSFFDGKYMQNSIYM